MKLKISILIVALFLVLGIANSYAFCIHNNTDTIIIVKQTSGGKGWPFTFNKNIDSGKQECCNWQNGDCNTSGKRDSLVGFDVSYGAYFNIVGICAGFKIKAGGDLIVKGKKGNYRCITVNR